MSRDLPKFQFGGGGLGVCSVVVKTQRAKVCLNFNWGRGCSGPNPRTGCSCQFDQKFRLATFFQVLASQIVSHILRMLRLVSVDTVKFVGHCKGEKLKKQGCFAITLYPSYHFYSVRFQSNNFFAFFK